MATVGLDECVRIAVKNQFMIKNRNEDIRFYMSMSLSLISFCHLFEHIREYVISNFNENKNTLQALFVFFGLLGMSKR